MEVLKLIEAQREYFNSNETKNVAFRIAQLKQLYSAIKKNEALLEDAIYKDFKKSKFDTYTTEVGLLYIDIKQNIKHIKKWSAIKKVKTNLANFPGKSYTIPEPLGVTLIIGAWNYPYLLSLAPAIAAIAAGNTVVLKPSEVPENTSHAIAKIIGEHFDPKFFTVVEGGVTVTTELLNHKFDKIFFTGSVPVGKIIYQAAAKHLTPVTLELGGKSPAFVLQDCNLSVTAKRLIWAKFLNAGQTCIAPDYVLVHKSVEKQFLEKAKQEIANSHFTIEDNNYVQIINDKNVERLAKLIDPAKVYCGGRVDVQSRIIEPTVLHNSSFDDEVMCDEIFCPILPVIAYENLDEAIAKVKTRPKPLSCYVFTDNKTHKQKILTEISFGGGAVNDAMMHIANPNFPFGGVGDSGIGSYHGEAGFKTFSHFKSILEKGTSLETPLKYYPHTAQKLKWAKRIMGKLS